VARGLHHLESELDEILVRHTGLEAMQLGLLVHVGFKYVRGLLLGPRLVGNVAIRRIDHSALARFYASLGHGMVLDFEHRVASIGSAPESLEIGMAIGETRERTGGSIGLSSASALAALFPAWLRCLIVRGF